MPKSLKDYEHKNEKKKKKKILMNKQRKKKRGKHVKRAGKGKKRKH